MKNLLIIFLVLVVSCGSDSSDDSTLTKAEVVALGTNSKADNPVDYCKQNGWYGDGTCDTFCTNIDTADCKSDPQKADSKTACNAICSKEAADSCLEEDQCQNACEGLKGWTEKESASFTSCIEKPLCYRTLQECMADKPVDRCEAACSNRLPKGSCFDNDVCLDHCSKNEKTWDAKSFSAFEKCADENELCFQTIDQCVQAQ